MSLIRKNTYQGLQKNIKNLKLPKIDVWENKYQDRDYLINLSYPEFTCICPKTGLPDFATIKINYIADKTCVELKSLKLYFVAYRNVGIFHEHLVNRILDDIIQACNPRWIKVEGIVNSRGGIQTTVVAEKHLKKLINAEKNNLDRDIG